MSSGNRGAGDEAVAPESREAATLGEMSSSFLTGSKASGARVGGGGLWGVVSCEADAVLEKQCEFLHTWENL